jgi:hypothetical protein
MSHWDTTSLSLLQKCPKGFQSLSAYVALDAFSVNPCSFRADPEKEMIRPSGVRPGFVQRATFLAGKGILHDIDADGSGHRQPTVSTSKLASTTMAGLTAGVAFMYGTAELVKI